MLLYGFYDRQEAKKGDKNDYATKDILTRIIDQFLFVVRNILFMLETPYHDGIEYWHEIPSQFRKGIFNMRRDFIEELKNPAVKYTAPEGELLVAVDKTDHVIGMVAYHKHNAERCEMKRLYVKPQARGMHLGELLVKEIIEHAKQSGYKEMVLDTIVPLKAAMIMVYGHLPDDKEKILAMLKQGADEQGEDRLRMRRDSMRSL